jgi:16S rRNA (guanine966-N2)-methyltransferase
MRISGGELRGRTITAPRGTTTRPTSEFLRQVAFNLLGDAVRGARVLDLYAGCGAFGLEALSRGAEAAIFVEQDRAAVKALRANLAALGLAGRAAVMPAPVRAALTGLGERAGWVDLAFLDPPYGDPGLLPGLEALASGELLRDNALVLVQAFHKGSPPDGVGCLRCVIRRRHGETCLCLYRKEHPCR